MATGLVVGKGFIGSSLVGKSDAYVPPPEAFVKIEFRAA